jgi:hypothetical protein
MPRPLLPGRAGPAHRVERLAGAAGRLIAVPATRARAEAMGQPRESRPRYHLFAPGRRRRSTRNQREALFRHNCRHDGLGIQQQSLCQIPVHEDRCPTVGAIFRGQLTRSHD